MQEPDQQPPLSDLYQQRVTQLIHVIKGLQGRIESASKSDAESMMKMQENEKLMGVMESKLNAAQEEVSLHKKEMDQLCEENKWLETKIKNQARIGTEKDTMIEKQEEQLEKLRMELQVSEKQREVSEMKTKQLAKEIKEIREELNSKEGELETKDKIQEITNSELESLQEKYESMKKEKLELVKENQEMKLAKEISDTKTQMDHYSEKKLLELSKNQLITQNAHLKEEIKRVSEECYQAQESYKEERVLKKVVQEERNRIKREIESLRQEFKQQERRLEERSNEAHSSLKALSQDHQQALERCEGLESELERVKSDLNRYRQRDEDLASRINNNEYFIRQVYVVTLIRGEDEHNTHIIISNYQETKRELEIVNSQKEELLREVGSLKANQARYEPEMRAMQSRLEIMSQAYNGRLQKLRELEAEREPMKKRLNEAELGYQHFKKETGALKKEIGLLRQKLIEALSQNRVNNRKDQIAELIDQNAELRREIESHEKELAEAKIEIDIKLKQVVTKYESQIMNLHAQLDQQDEGGRVKLGSKLDQLSQILKESRNMRKRDQVIEVLKHLPTVGEQLSLKREGVAKSKQMSNCIDRLNELESQNKTLNETVQIYKEEAEKCRRETESKKKELWSVKQELKSMEEKKVKAEIEGEQINGKNAELRGQLSSQSQLIEQMKSAEQELHQKVQEKEIQSAKQKYELERHKLESDNATRRVAQLTSEREKLMLLNEKLSVKVKESNEGGGNRGLFGMINQPGFRASIGRSQESDVEAQVREANYQNIIANLRAKIEKQSNALQAVEVLLGGIKKQQKHWSKKKVEKVIKEVEQDPLELLKVDLHGLGTGEMGSAQLVSELSLELQEKEAQIKKLQDLVSKQEREFSELIEQHQEVLTQTEERELAARVEEDADLQELKTQLEKLEEAGERHENEKRRLVQELSRQNAEMVTELKKLEEERRKMEKELYNKSEDLKAAQLWIDTLEEKNKEMKQKGEVNQQEKRVLEERMRVLEIKELELEELQGDEAVKEVEIEGLKELIAMKDKMRQQQIEKSEEKLHEMQGELASLKELNKALHQTVEGVTELKQANLLTSLRQKGEEQNKKKAELELELKTTRKRLQEKSEQLCQARAKIMVLSEEKKLIQLEASRTQLQAERVQDLEDEIEQLRKESERLHTENNKLYGQFKEGDNQIHELNLRGRNLENQNLMLTRQIEFLKKHEDSKPSGKPENPVNLQIGKLLKVIRKARQLNQAHLDHRKRMESLLSQRKGSELEEDLEPPKQKKSNLE